MEKVVGVVSKYCDIDTKRALGIPPGRLEGWKHFVPRTRKQFYKYYRNKQTSEYFSFLEWGQFLHIFAKNIVYEGLSGYGDPRWRFTDRSMEHHYCVSNDTIEVYKRCLPPGVHYQMSPVSLEIEN